MSILMVSGCATTSELRKLSIGMDKKEVIDILGKPISTRASTRPSGMVEIWDYKFAKNVLGFPPVRDTYWIFLKIIRFFNGAKKMTGVILRKIQIMLKRLLLIIKLERKTLVFLEMP